MWCALYLLFTIVLFTKGQESCLVEDFAGGSNGLFNYECGGVVPFKTTSYDYSDVPEPDDSNGYFLSTVLNSQSSCLINENSVNVVAGTQVVLNYYVKGTASDCVAMVLPTNDVAIISIDNSNKWQSLSITVSSTANIFLQIQCGEMNEAQLVIDSIIFKNTDDCPREVRTTTTEPLTEEPSTEDPSTDDPFTDEPSTEEPSTDEPFTEDPSTDEPFTNVPSTEDPSTDEPLTEEPSTEDSSTDEPFTDEPLTEEPSTENPSTDEPFTDEPSTDEPSTEDPSTDEPFTDEPSTEDPSTDEPLTEEPSTEDPSTDEPFTDEPSTEEPSTEDPSTDEPFTDEPSTEDPPTEEPSTEEPSTTQEPSTEEPTTEESTKVCAIEEFELDNMGLFNVLCTGWAQFIAGSYNDFGYPRPDDSNGFFLSSQQSVIGTCARTEEDIYVDGDSEVVFKYYVLGTSTSCIFRLESNGATLTSEVILMDNSLEWKTISLVTENPATVAIVAQCGGATTARLIIDYVSVESSTGVCSEELKTNRFLRYLLK